MFELPLYHRSFRNNGFTIVELLIVTVVIAILAAISIVAYTGMQNRAYDTSVKNDLSVFARKIGLARVEAGRSDYLSGNTPADNSGYNLPSLGLKVSRRSYAESSATIFNLLYCRDVAGTTYALLATSKSGKRFYISNIEGLSEYVGAVSWATNNYVAQCGSVVTGTTAGGAGYNIESVTGGWRDWAGS